MNILCFDKNTKQYFQNVNHVFFVVNITLTIKILRTKDYFESYYNIQHGNNAKVKTIYHIYNMRENEKINVEE